VPQKIYKIRSSAGRRAPCHHADAAIITLFMPSALQPNRSMSPYTAYSSMMDMGYNPGKWRIKGMSRELDRKINSFLTRKEAEFPELILPVSGRDEARTTKYAVHLRETGQVLMPR
jgi:hypothetical protein